MATVNSVSATNTDGAYATGATVTVTVEFSAVVNVDTTGGLPTLLLAGGVGSATYVAGSGSSILSFEYTVGIGDQSADLDYASSSALMLNGGAIMDLGTPAVLTLPTPGAAGSLGANKAIVIDAVAPSTSVASAAFSADSGASSSDFITNTAAQTISGTLSSNLAAGDEVEVSIDNGTSWHTATTATGSANWSYSANLSESSTLRVRVVDALGNPGAVLAQAYVLDTAVPSEVGGIVLSVDTGSVSNDFITNVSAQTISGVLGGPLGAGDTVEVSIDDGHTWSTASAGAGVYSYAATLTGDDVLKVRVVDLAGNASTIVSQAYVIDTAAATPSAPDLIASSDTGASSTDNITSDTTPVLAGTSEANAAVALFDTDGMTVLGVATADGTGTWSITSNALSEGQHTLTVRATDLAGNVSAVSAGLTITIEAASPPVTPPPSVISVVTPAGSQVTGDAAGNVITWSGAGADTILGGAGDDRLTGGPNNDVLQGNTGDDNISAGLGADVVRGGQGNDFVNGNQGGDLLFGDLGDDSVAGGQGDDFVHGNQGNDVVLGDLGDDILLGGQGDDVVWGGAGADHLSGDLGHDILIGGAGADRFNFVGGAGRDVVLDFNSAEGDRILLSVTQAADFQALSGKMAMVGADTVITLDGQTIVLVGAPMSSLAASDFVFS